MRQLKVGRRGQMRPAMTKQSGGNYVPKPIKSTGSNRTGSSKIANTRRPTGARLR